MSLTLKALTKSPWVFHLSTGSCNNCDIEILELLTPKYDAERFGIQLVGSPRHADVVLLTGAMNMKSAVRVRRLIEQVPQPRVVIAFGCCSCSQGIFRGSYVMPEEPDKVLPVDLYIPGCPPKPEAMIAGIVKLLGKVKGKK